MNNDIKNNVKYKISMYKYIEEKKSKKKEFKYKKLAYTCGLILLIMTSGVSAKNIINYFGLNASKGVNKAVSNNYLEIVNTDYQDLTDNIAIKIKSYLIDNYNLAINFELNNKINNHIRFNDLIIRDENGNTIFDSSINNLSNAVNIEDNIVHLNIYAENIPPVKTLNVSLSNITINNKNTIGNTISFTLNVPEQMQSRKTINYYAISSNISNAHFEEASLSNTALKIKFSNGTDNYELLNNSKNIWDIPKNNNVYIELNDGTKIDLSSRSDIGGVSINKNQISFTYFFNLTKFDNSDEFKVHIIDENDDMIINYKRVQ